MSKKAVALSYAQESNQAPRIIASGEGKFATQIIQIAQNNEIHLIQDPSLVDSLAELPVGSEIPKELYESVAIIFRYLLSHSKKKNN
jgi:flagellar biosynthesis protein